MAALHPLALGPAVLGPDLQPHRRRIVVAPLCTSAPKARFIAKPTYSTSVRQLRRPLVEYMRLPASQYSVLDAERIERIDGNTFRCYAYRFKFLAFEVCPVLLVRVDEETFGCCIRLLSCKVSIEIPFAFLPITVQVIESTGTQVLEQFLRIMLPRFLKQLVKDYEAWASGDTSRQPLGTGQI